MMNALIHYGFLALISVFVVLAWRDQIKDERKWKRDWSHGDINLTGRKSDELD